MAFLKLPILCERPHQSSAPSSVLAAKSARQTGHLPLYSEVDMDHCAMQGSQKVCPQGSKATISASSMQMQQAPSLGQAP